MTAPTSRSTIGELMALALPIMGSFLATIAMLVADGVLCGHISDNGRSLTALGFAAQLWFLVSIPAAALGAGTVAVTSRARGAGDTERVNGALAQAAQIAVIAGTICGVVMATFSYDLLRLLGASPDVAELGTRYLRWLSLGWPAVFLHVGCLQPVLRSVGNARVPFYCGVVGNLFNIVLAYGLVLGHFGMPAIGLPGAGLAMASANMLIALLLLAAIRTMATDGLSVRLRIVAIHRSIASQIVRVTLPHLVERLTFYGAMTAIVAMLARIDERAVAAHSLGARSAGMLQIPLFGIQMAMGTMVGNALGRNSVDDARRAFRLAAVMALVVMVPIAVATFVAAPWIAEAFGIAPNSSVGHYAVTWLHIVAIAVVPQALMAQLEGLLLGAGASRTVMKINVLTDVGLRMTLALVLGFATDLGAAGVWLSWPLTLAVQLPLAIVAYRRGRWAVTGVSIDK